MEFFQALSQCEDPLKMSLYEGEPVQDIIKPVLSIHLALHQGGGDDLPLGPPSLQHTTLYSLVCLGLTPQLNTIQPDTLILDES